MSILKTAYQNLLKEEKEKLGFLPEEQANHEMTKWQLINACESFDDLKIAIMAIADENQEIQGRSKKRKAISEVLSASAYISGKIDNPSVLTRSYGIRQQAIYIKEYERREKKSST